MESALAITYTVEQDVLHFLGFDDAPPSESELRELQQRLMAARDPKRKSRMPKPDPQSMRHTQALLDRLTDLGVMDMREQPQSAKEGGRSNRTNNVSGR